jgi:hypothetical protein
MQDDNLSIWYEGKVLLSARKDDEPNEVLVAVSKEEIAYVMRYTALHGRPPLHALTMEEAKSLKKGQELYHTWRCNADGTSMRFKVSSIYTWKRELDHIVLVVKYGLRGHLRFDENSLYQLTLGVD